MASHSTFHTGNHQVFDPDISESAASHNAVIAPPRAVAIEIFIGDFMIQQVMAGGRRLFDAAGWRDVVGCY